MSQVIQSGSACLVMLFVATAVTYAEAASDDSPKESENRVADVAEELTELSVAPSTHVEFPENRPQWLDAPPTLDGDVHVWSVVCTGRETVKRCDADLKDLRRAAVGSYIQFLTGSVSDETFPINDDWIENELITDRYVGTCVIGDTELKEVAIRLEFDQDTQKKILASHRNREVGERLAATGAFIGFGFVLLICASSLLGIVSRRVQKREASQYASLGV